METGPWASGSSAADLLSAIRGLHASIAMLAGRMRNIESQLNGVEQHVRELTLAVPLLVTAGVAAGRTEAGDTLARRPDPGVTQRFSNFEDSLMAAERRLNNQETALNAIVYTLTSLGGVAQQAHVNSSSSSDLTALASGVRNSSSSSSDLASLAAAVQAMALPSAGAAGPAAEASLREALQAPHANGGDSQVSTSQDPGANGDASAAASAAASFPSLRSHGQQPSRGGALHPDRCTPCSFFCFSRRGCKKRADCEYCHMLHVVRTARRSAKAKPDRTQRAEPTAYV